MMRVRELGIEDLDVWAEMRMALWPSSTIEVHKIEIEELTSDRNFIAFVAEDNSKAVGFLEAFIRPFANGCESRPVPFLEGIWVANDYRRSGIAKTLLTRFEGWAQDRGFQEIGSDVEIGNQQSELAHRSWGFEETERVIYFRKKLG